MAGRHVVAPQSQRIALLIRTCVRISVLTHVLPSAGFLSDLRRQVSPDLDDATPDFAAKLWAAVGCSGSPVIQCDGGPGSVCLSPTLTCRRLRCQSCCWSFFLFLWSFFQLPSSNPPHSVPPHPYQAERLLPTKWAKWGAEAAGPKRRAAAKAVADLAPEQALAAAVGGSEGAGKAAREFLDRAADLAYARGIAGEWRLLGTKRSLLPLQ